MIHLIVLTHPYLCPLSPVVLFQSLAFIMLTPGPSHMKFLFIWNTFSFPMVLTNSYLLFYNSCLFFLSSQNGQVLLSTYSEHLMCNLMFTYEVI